MVTETRDIALSRQRTTKALIRLRGYAPLLFVYDISHVFSWPGSFTFSVEHSYLNNIKLLEKKTYLENMYPYIIIKRYIIEEKCI